MAESNQRTIWKFPFKVDDEQSLRIPRVHELLTIQIQDGVPTLWAMVNPLTAMQQLTIYCYGTGNPGPPPEQKYIATVQLNGFVWHFYERGE